MKLREKVEGKTKILTPRPDDASIARVKAKKALTWGNTNSVDVEHKDVWATTTTCNVFKALEANGCETTFIEQVSDTEFDAHVAEMFPFEIVVRNKNEEKGSFKKRYSQVPLGKLTTPVVEFFLKSKDKVFNGVDLPDDDPLVTSVQDDGVWVHHPGRPVVGLGTFVPVRNYGDLRLLVNELTKLALRDAEVLRVLWAKLGWDLGDVKLEYGRVTVLVQGREEFKTLLADVVDNDSWRIRDPQGIERSKQNVRDKNSVEGADIDYKMVAEASMKLAA